jgi:hypothetical protein
MVQIVSFAICLVFDIIVLFYIGDPVGTAMAGAVSLIVFGSWGNYIICLITTDVKDQINDIESLRQLERARDAVIEEFTKDKEAIDTALAKYKGEVEDTLLETYKQFEESIMEKIKDSKLLAMVMKKSGYSDLLARYHSNIIDLTSRLRKCDQGINHARCTCEDNKISLEKKMLIRQGKSIFGFHYFFPKHLIYREE